MFVSMIIIYLAVGGDRRRGGIERRIRGDPGPLRRRSTIISPYFRFLQNWILNTS